MIKKSLLLDPTAGGGKGKVALAPRPMDLAGKVVGLLDNTKEQGTLILETLGRALREQHGAAKVILVPKEHYSKPADPKIIDQIAQEAQVAIAAVGG
jgi:hypothetical protein